MFYGRKQELKTLEKEYLKKNSLCSIYEARRIGKNEILGGIYYPIQNLIIDKSELGRSIEIDGVARDGDSLLVIECKFTNEKRSIRDYEKMVENTSIKMFEGIKKYNYYIVSKTGFDKTLTDLKKDNLHLISIDEMMSIQ